MNALTGREETNRPAQARKCQTASAAVRHKKKQVRSYARYGRAGPTWSLLLRATSLAGRHQGEAGGAGTGKGCGGGCGKDGDALCPRHTVPLLFFPLLGACLSWLLLLLLRGSEESATRARRQKTLFEPSSDSASPQEACSVSSIIARCTVAVEWHVRPRPPPRRPPSLCPVIPHFSPLLTCSGQPLPRAFACAFLCVRVAPPRTVFFPTSSALSRNECPSRCQHKHIQQDRHTATSPRLWMP